MKKLFAVLSISAMSFCAFLGGAKTRSYQPMLAEQESSQTMSSSEQSSSETSQEHIDVDKETKEIISNTAKDVIEVIKIIFNQPIVIGGVSTTLGVLVLFVIGKIFGNYLSKRNTKYDKKIKELFEQIGIDSEAIKMLLEQANIDRKVILEMIENTKNIKVKEKLLEMYNSKKEPVEQVIELDKEQLETIVKTNQDAIKELLEK